MMQRNGVNPTQCCFEALRASVVWKRRGTIEMLVDAMDGKDRKRADEIAAKGEELFGSQYSRKQVNCPQGTRYRFIHIRDLVPDLVRRNLCSIVLLALRCLRPRERNLLRDLMQELALLEEVNRYLICDWGIDD